MGEHDEVFQIAARRCRRCGGLLTSAKSIRDGYGHSCLQRVRQERLRQEEARMQYSLFDEEVEDHGIHDSGTV